MTDADWLAAVAAAPDDQLVRLAYADWLDDRDDPRAELLRLDVQIEGRSDEATEVLCRLAAVADPGWRAVACRVPVEPIGVRDWYTHTNCDCGRPEQVAAEFFITGWSGRHEFFRQPGQPNRTRPVV